MKKVFFITGASSGIGREVTKQLIKKGHSVYACARRQNRLEKFKEEVDSLSGSFAYSVCDVTNLSQLKEAVSQAVSRFGKIDIVYANAGFGVAGRFSKLQTEDFKRQFDTNVFGVLDTVYACLPEILKNKGSIVLMGSVNSHISEPKKTPYCMSKFAIKALADGLYWEMKPLGVAVTLISPGIVDSEIRKVDKHGLYNPEAKDPAPKKLMMRTSKAAGQIIDAIFARKKERVITGHGQAFVLANRYAPTLLTPLLKQGKSASRPKE